MIPVTLSLKNFLCYRDNAPTLYLDGVHLACLCGPNGHGKSTLLDAITWVLWGEARGSGRRGHRQEDLIHHGESEMQVSLVFDAHGIRYRVVRRHARGIRSRQGSTSLDLQVSSGDGTGTTSGGPFLPISGNSIADTQGKILRLLNMDYKTFVNSAFLVQGHADEFSQASADQRKEVLSRVLGLGLYDRLEERARAILRERRGVTRAIEMEQERLAKEIDRKTEHQQMLVAVEENLSQVEISVQNQTRKLETLRTSVEHLRHRIKEFDTLQKQVSEYKRQLSSLEEQADQRKGRATAYRAQAQEIPLLERKVHLVRQEMAKLDVEENLLHPMRAQCQNISLEIHKLTLDNARLKEEMADLRAKVDLLERERENPRCPLCNSALVEEGCQHLANNYEAKGKEKATAYRENDSTMRQLVAKSKKWQAELSQAEDGLKQRRRDGEKCILALESDVQEAKVSAGLVVAEEEAMRLDEDMIQSRKMELGGAEDRMGAIGEDIREFPSLEQRLKEDEQECRRLTVEKEELWGKRGAIHNQLDAITNMEYEARGNTQSLHTNQEEVAVYEELARAFGKGGIQALLIDLNLERIEDEANRLLGRMTDHRMTVKLQTQRERRTRPEEDPIETLDIFIADELGTRDYQMFSGGEKFRIDFALRIALSKVLAWRAGAPLPTLFIDEGFGTQDATGREKVLDVIRAIENDFQRIIVITHMDEIKEAFPVRIEVAKGEHGSTFSMS